jgi:metal-responsive CopG/Arc/MetJ family transcriptional regulator
MLDNTPTTTVSVRLSPTMLARLDRLVGDDCIHRGEVIRRLLSTALARTDEATALPGSRAGS